MSQIIDLKKDKQDEDQEVVAGQDQLIVYRAYQRKRQRDIHCYGT